MIFLLTQGCKYTIVGLSTQTQKGYEMKLAFEKTTCSRCNGTGRYSFNLMHGNVCFGCSGTKTQITANGKRAQKAYSAALAKNQALAGDLRVGDIIRRHDCSQWARIVKIAPNDLGNLQITTNRKSGGPVGGQYTIFKAPAETVTIAPSNGSEGLREIFTAIAAKYKGAELIDWNSGIGTN